LESLGPDRLRVSLKRISDDEADFLLEDWLRYARPEQRAPDDRDWRIWLFMGGRGAGKTRSGAEWVAEGVANGAFKRIGLVGATYQDARAVMIEGVSGLKAISNGAHFEPSNRRIKWDDGAIATLLSADEPDSIRGHQFDAIWADEFAKWPNPQEALDMLLMSLRIGADPRMAITTTPRNIAALKNLLASPDVAVTSGTTAANADNLAPGFLETMARRYAGSRLGRQELDAEIIEDNSDALWQRAWIDATRVGAAPALLRVAVAVDPPASAHGDACGIVVAGIAADGDAYVIADLTADSLTPGQWSSRVAAAYDAYGADVVIAEANQGGDMVKTVLAHARANLPVRLVHATRDKITRAMPYAQLYEQGRVHHVGPLPELEDELCTYDGTGPSPDRMDALVWALAHLKPATAAVEPHIRKPF
jgi:phage terminase large subunit-like protein